MQRIANNKDGITNGGEDMRGFLWRSWLGASVLLFLAFGVINIALAIAVPATLHFNGAFPAPYSVLETNTYWAN